MPVDDILPPKRLRLGNLLVDHVTFDGAIDAISALVEYGEGGSVFTPNVDHVLTVDEDPRLRQAYAEASLSLVDGMPVLWASRLLGEPLPEKISGSDLVVPMIARAAERGWRVYFLGGNDGVADRAAATLIAQFPGLQIVGTDSSFIDVDRDSKASSPVIQKIQAAKPDLIFVALGAPKQEIWIHQSLPLLAPAVALGIGASLDFIAGTVKRAPSWMAKSGFEWLFRLGQEPKRLWRRYLVKGPKFRHVLIRALKEPKEQRVVHRTSSLPPASPEALTTVQVPKQANVPRIPDV